MVAVMFVALAGCSPSMADSCTRKCEAEKSCTGGDFVAECRRGCEQEAAMFPGCQAQFQGVVECTADSLEECAADWRSRCESEAERLSDCLN